MSTLPRRAVQPATQLEHWLCIERDGTIVGRSGKVEYGQGIRTGFARIIADELAVSLERVRVELGDTDRVPWDMGTFGSLSTATDGQTLRAAAIAARRLLLQRASIHLGVGAAELELRDGQVTASDGRAVSFQVLTQATPLVGSFSSALAGHAPGQGASSEWVGNANGAHDAGAAPLPRLEARDIVLGRPRFSADVRLPGMLYARTLHGPVFDARLRSLEDQKASTMPGVIAVIADQSFVGVLAERDEQATSAVGALRAHWSAALRVSSGREIALRSDGGADAALTGAALRLSATYRMPHVAHAPIAPSAAVADVRPSGVQLYVATQRPFGLRAEIAALLRIDEARIHVHPQAMGGMFGRGNVSDAAIEAVRLSQAVARPVLLQWTREEEFRLSPQRPALDATLEAGLDAGGTIVGWRHRASTNPHTYGGGEDDAALIAMTAGRNAVPPYRLSCAEVLLKVQPGAVRTGALRSLAASQHVFAIESFMDELAAAAHEDPVTFRQRHSDDGRLQRVLDRVRDRSGWSARDRQRERGLGIACAVYNGTYIAQIAQVSLSGAALRLERVWCAVDAGRLIWPQGGRNQIEGAIQQGASWALLERLAHDEHQVISCTWRDYPIATCLDAPDDIDVDFILNPAAAPTGLGEPGVVPIAAAIANAVVDAGGPRVRELPLAAAVLGARYAARPAQPRA